MPLKRSQSKVTQAQEAILLYETIFAHAPIGIEIYDSEGLLIEVNKKCLEIFGVTDVSFIKAFKLFDDPNISAADRAALKNGESVQFEAPFNFDIVRAMRLYPSVKTGRIHIHVIIEPVKKLLDDKTSGYMVLVNDITDKKNSEEALSLRKKQYDDLVAKVRVGLYLLRSNPSGSFVFEYVSPIWAEMCGLTADEIARDPGLAFKPIHPDEIDAFIKLNMECIQKRLPFEWGGKALVNGAVKWLQIESTPEPLPNGDTLWHGFITDVTARKKTEEALRDSQANLHAVFNATDESIFLIDKNDVVLELNDIAARRIGRARNDVIGLSAHDLVPPDVAERRKAFIDRAKATGKPVDFEDERTGRWMMNNLYPVLNDDGEVVRMAAFSRDITEQKIAEQALTESRDMLRKFAAQLVTVREEERTAIAREIHDEFGQNLTALNLTVAALIKKLSSDPELHPKVVRMRDSIHKLIQDVRRISTDLRPGVLDELGLGAAVEWHAHKFIRESGIQCTLDIDPHIGPLPQHLATGMFRIFQESLTNVVRHSGATVVAMKLALINNSLLLEVADNGRGVPESGLTDLKSIGIVGMKERALALGGEVVISSEPGCGTTITATIPLEVK